MTKLTNEELRKLLRQYAAVSYAYTVAERDSDDESKAEAKSDELEAEIIKRMAEGAAGEASPQTLEAIAAEIGTAIASALGRKGIHALTADDGLGKIALEILRKSGSASTAGPRPDDTKEARSAGDKRRNNCFGVISQAEPPKKEEM